MHSPVSETYRFKAIKPVLLVSMLASCFATSAIAEEIAGTEEKTLQPVVVTASRVEQLQKDAIPSTTVITSKMIENKKLADLPSLLKTEAGIEITQSGGAGSTTSVFMRGMNANQVLILLDGIPVRDATSLGTAAALEHIQPDQIDRIEIVRGNVSAIYGTGAMGGVIQIFTKQGSGKPTANVFAEYGSHDTVKFGAGVSGQSEGTRFSLSATRLKTNGFSSINPDKYPNANPDKDGDRNVTVNASISQKLNKDNEIGARLYMYDAKYDYDSDYKYADPKEIEIGKSKMKTASFYSKNRFTSNWNSTLTLSHSEIRREGDISNTAYPSSFGFKSNENLLQWTNQIALTSNWMATAGVDVGHEKADVDNPDKAGKESRTSYSVYAGVNGKIGAHNLQANVRYDHVENSGADVTGYLGYGYDLTTDWKLIASVSTSFLAPTLYQQYAPWGYGNSDLKAERSRTAEAGIQYSKGKTLVRATVFEWRSKDLINTAFQNGSYRYYNVEKAKNLGFELNAQTNLVGLDWHANLTIQDPKDRTTDLTLGRRAKNYGSLGVSKTFGPWYLGGDLSYTGSRSDGPQASANTLDSYWLANLNARYNLNKNVSLYARIENLFDKNYETAWGYNQPGRGAYVGVNFKM